MSQCLLLSRSHFLFLFVPFKSESESSVPSQTVEPVKRTVIGASVSKATCAQSILTNCDEIKLEYRRLHFFLRPPNCPLPFLNVLILLLLQIYHPKLLIQLTGIHSHLHFVVNGGFMGC